MVSWADFIKEPSKASRQLHVSSKDVRAGQRQDALEAQRRNYLEANQAIRKIRDQQEAELFRPNYEGLRTRTYAEEPSAPHPTFEQRLGQKLVGGAALPASLLAMAPSLSLRAGTAIGGLAGALGSADAEDAATSGGLAALAVPGAMKAALGLGAGAAAAYSPEAQAVIKPKGGNWLAGSVEDALRGLKRQASRFENPNLTAEEVTQINSSPINSWIEGPLTKYVKTRMASPEDEVRKLAEQGVLHFDPATLPHGSMDILKGNAADRRVRGGQSIEGVAQSPMAQAWETMSDAATGVGPAGQRRHFQTMLDKNPWLDTIDPQTPVYHFSNPTGSLGFPHLIDELSNALNPESGLPRNLQLTPEAVQQMSMEKAVRRVADINAWRAAQKVEANRKLAEQASLVREYAENNPKGLRWVQLRQNEFTSPEQLTPRAQEKYQQYLNAGVGEETALRNAAKHDTTLADQLKYEGDTMGHCVGGYCDDVLSGRSQIYSLRDARGEPHVTVEVAPNQPKEINKWNVREALTPEEAEVYFEAGRTGNYNSIADQLKGVGLYDTIARRLGHGIPEQQLHIKQIKGKQNKAPNPEYLPFVQDFVRNPHTGQPWADVGDFSNTGLKRLTDFGDEPMIQSAREKFGDYITPEEWESIMAGKEKFAAGGAVEAQQPNPWHAAFGRN